MRRLAGISRTATTAVAIALAAMALPAVIFAVAGTQQSAIVVFAKTIDPDGLPRSVSILSWNEHVARLDGIDAKTARALYAEGAVLVMPFRKSGCMSFRKT
ncbi:MAG: hypothetical protein JWM58_3223 [Rhizobium sp.]|nr:hypothetical protein [Rhizobium sp.]